MKQVQKIAGEVFAGKVAIHIIFIIFFMLFCCTPAILGGMPISRILPVIIFAIFLLLCVYTGRWICRKWLLSGRLIQFILYSTALIIVFSVIGVMGLRHFSGNPGIVMVIAVISVFIAFYLLGAFLSLTRTTILRQFRDMTIVQQRRESELQLLRSQLSPHFLFNVLNNLYGLSITHDQRVPALLVKLSDLLRYSIYDTSKDFVPLANEIAYINNYVELEKVRIGKSLTFDSDIQDSDIESVRIAPMLLIVFIENAFKHSKNTLLPEIHVMMGLHVAGDNLIFEVKNTCSEKSAGQNNGESSGIGLAVTIKRLDLLYPGRYSLEKSIDKGYFMIKLELKIK